ncbi:MAG: hypothetical protein PQJ46_04335 [Spirochaetales bacterium]|nr:hypothetical protein [Spirochaetales bacterium]
MAYSDDFIRVLNKKAKKEEVSLSELRFLFFSFLKVLPEDLQWDIFNFYFDNLEDNDSIFMEKAEHLSVLIDLFEGEYDENKIDLTDEELEYISEGVNDYAMQLSDELIMNVMRAAVARGLMG